MRRPAHPHAWKGGALLAWLVAAVVACSPELGDTPARCSADGACPEGYECIRAVCARAGTAVPIEVVRVGNLRGVDLRVIPQSTGVLVAWQTYAYSEEGEGFWAARVDAGGNVSEAMRLVAPFEADEGLIEPYYDLLATSDTSLLLAASAAPVDDAIEPRLITFAITLPPEGQEGAGTSFRAAWSREVRMPTVGYGAVSRPRLVAVGEEVWLGYVQSRVASAGDDGGDGGGSGGDAAGGGGSGGEADAAGGGGGEAGGGGGVEAAGETVAELAVFRLDRSGVPLDPPACADATCCQADLCVAARASLPVAVGVADALPAADGAWFVLDEVRPSALRLSAVEGALSAEVAEQLLPTLSVPVEADGTSLLLVVPSQRGGAQLPSDPVVGDAALQRLVLVGDGAGLQPVAALPAVRDTPRPAWVPRPGQRSLLVTPGGDVAAPRLLVLAVDPATGAHEEVARIDRQSTLELGGLGAAQVGGTLFVVWVDAGEDEAVLRGEVLSAPP